MSVLRAAVIAVFFAGAACSGDEPQLLDDEEIVAAGERVAPELVLQQPARGLFTSDPTVVVSGAVQKRSAPLVSVSVNDVDAVLDGGFFRTELPLTPGPNLIGVRAEAEDRGRAVDAVTVFAGAVRAPGARIENAVHVHLGREFLDNNTDELDDIASIVALIISDEAFLMSLASEPFEVGDDTITVTRIEVAGADVDLVPETNCVAAGVTVRGAQIDLRATGIAAILGEDVFVTADGATVELLVCGTDSPGEFAIVQSDVRFDNLLLATNDNPDLAEDLPSTHASLVNILELALSNWLGGSLGGFLTDLLAIFTLEYTFGDLHFSYSLTELSAHPGGLELYLGGSVSSPFGLPQMWAGAGSLRTDDPRLPDTFSTAPVAIAMSDDALNQLFFAYWWSGSIGDYEVDPAALSALPEVFQPLTSFEVELGLPPTLLPPTQPEYPYDLAVGEVGLRMLVGGERNFAAGIHFRSGVDIAIDEQGGIGIAMDGRAQKIVVHANVTETPPANDKGDVAALLRLIVPSVLGSVDVSYGGFPLPDFELSAFSENVAAFAGRSISFVPSRTARAGEGGGYLVLEGSLRDRGQ